VLARTGQLHLAPIGPNPQRILDLGTGTGIWAIEMGKSMVPPLLVLNFRKVIGTLLLMYAPSQSSLKRSI